MRIFVKWINHLLPLGRFISTAFIYYVVGRKLTNTVDVSGTGKCLVKREIVTALPYNQEHAAWEPVAEEERMSNLVQNNIMMSVFFLRTAWCVCSCLYCVQALQPIDYEFLVNSAIRCLYMARFPDPYSSALKTNSSGMKLAAYETPTCGPPMALTGQLEAHFNISSQRMCGVAWLKCCSLDHSFWRNVKLLSALLTSELSLLMEDVPLETRLWTKFHHDWAPPHSGRKFIGFLTQRYGSRWVSRTGLVAWSPRSPDLIRRHLLLRSLTKETIYKTRIQTRVELLWRIMNIWEDFRWYNGQ